MPLLYCGWIGEGETRKAIDAAIESIPDDEQIPDSVASSILNLKKLVRQNWLAISEIQYVVFTASVAFEQSLDQLVQALDLDLAWVRMHSQLVQAAKLWEASGFDDDYLWGANRLKPVYEMIERRKPDLEPLVQNFIRPEQERLLAELEDINTPHLRRSWIGERLALIGDTRPGVGLRPDGLPDIVWCHVPGGEVTLRNNDSYGKPTINIGTFSVAPFYIAKYPVTYLQFQAFLDDIDNGFYSPEWWQDYTPKYQQQQILEQTFIYDNYPRTGIGWYQAMAFCRWLTARLPRDAWPTGEIPEDWIIRLPTEWEWQQSASGGQQDYEYPWGREWDSRWANVMESGLLRQMAVGMYPGGVSPVGAMDMSGNILELCLNEYDNPKNLTIQGNTARAMRGGRSGDGGVVSNVAYRLKIAADGGDMGGLGFRIALGPIPPGSSL